VDLSRKIGEFRSEYVADLGGKLALALHFLHSSNIVHRDISPRNIVLAEQGGDPIIIEPQPHGHDFGLARRLNPDAKSRFDSDYSAPEVRRVNSKWTKEADVYSALVAGI
jgi:serine/threonine protein kinase